MNPHTQIELTSPTGMKEVWWIPVPVGKAKIGEKIERQMYDQACAPTEDPFYSEDWTITQVCTTLAFEDLPKNARIATDFKREAETLSFMRI